MNVEKPLKKSHLHRCGASASSSSYTRYASDAASPRLAAKTFLTVFQWRASAFAMGMAAWTIALPAFAQSKTLDNPLRFQNIADFIQGVLEAVVMIALPIIVAFMVFAGFKFILARGSSTAINDAKKNFVYVIIGTIMILGAWVLATLIGGTVTQLLRG